MPVTISDEKIQLTVGENRTLEDVVTALTFMETIEKHVNKYRGNDFMGIGNILWALTESRRVSAKHVAEERKKLPDAAN